MTQIQITDAELLAKLQSKQLVDVTDAAGRVLGKVSFHPDPHPGIALTEEEVLKRVNDPNAKWIPAAEVEKRLRSRLKGSGNV